MKDAKNILIILQKKKRKQIRFFFLQLPLQGFKSKNATSLPKIFSCLWLLALKDLFTYNKVRLEFF